VRLRHEGGSGRFVRASGEKTIANDDGTEGILGWRQGAASCPHRYSQEHRKMSDHNAQSTSERAITCKLLFLRIEFSLRELGRVQAFQNYVKYTITPPSRKRKRGLSDAKESGSLPIEPTSLPDTQFVLALTVCVLIFKVGDPIPVYPPCFWSHSELYLCNTSQNRPL
jgi:hypothetical protein